MKNRLILKNQDWSSDKPESFNYEGRWIKNWFTNMELVNIVIDNVRWPSVENYYQAMKCKNDSDRKLFLTYTPKEAKYHSTRIKPREDWSDIKYEFMYIGCKAKWSLPGYKDKLLATGNNAIVEWNNWNDLTWGVDYKSGIGKNALGQILMLIRKEIDI